MERTPPLIRHDFGDKETGTPYLDPLALPVYLGLPSPPAAPLPELLLGLPCQAARGTRRLGLQALDQTEAGVHAAQVVTPWTHTQARLKRGTGI